MARTIRRRRKQLGKSQIDTANEANIDRTQYQALEYAVSNRQTRTPANPTLSTLIGLSQALECSIEDIIGDAVRDYQYAQSHFYDDK
ncbi:MAG: helix-turn-helix domain-containing protein [Arcanobacterium sp.]|nr:helix-turn-helix domain-containing protein [Arcanobacterium sp.]